MAKRRVALAGRGMAVTPHAKSLRDPSDRIDVTHALGPTAARRSAFSDRFPVFPLTGTSLEAQSHDGTAFTENPPVSGETSLSVHRLIKALLLAAETGGRVAVAGG